MKAYSLYCSSCIFFHVSDSLNHRDAFSQMETLYLSSEMNFARFFLITEKYV